MVAHGGAFAFTASPKPLSAKMTARMPPPPPSEDALNIMADPRVVRGSTYSLYRSGPGSGSGDRNVTSQQPYPTLRKQPRKRRVSVSIFDCAQPAVAREELDLSAYLIEKPRVLRVEEESCQTDGFLEALPVAVFVPLRTGVDVATSMDETDQPFAFDDEVVPLLKVLVGKTLAQALLEVEQEEELSEIAEDMRVKVAGRRAERERVEGLAVREASLRTRSKSSVSPVASPSGKSGGNARRARGR